MSRLRIKERIRRMKLALAWLQSRNTYSVDTYMWQFSHTGLMYTVGRLDVDDTSIRIARRDVDNFLSPQDCLNFMRFSQEQVMAMLEAFGVPDVVRTGCGYVVSGREALCVLLYRLAYPCRLKDTRLVFGLADSCISETFNYMVHFLCDTWGHLLSVDLERLVPKLEEFAEAVHDAGCPLTNCWAFIDGTVRGVARPSKGQRVFYNGHKRKHAIKFQGVMTRDGIFVDLHGPVPGTRHDAFLLTDSGLVPKLEGNMNSAAGEPFFTYGGPSYGLQSHIMCPYQEVSNGPLTPEMIGFNKSMSSARVAVEWGFKEMTSKWAFVDMKGQQKIWLSPVGRHYKVATLLSNVHGCLNGGNQISQYFKMKPPSLEEYLGLDNLVGCMVQHS